MIKDSRSYALIIAALASFLTPFVGSSINIALPAIGADLGISAVILGWIPTAYLLSLAVFLVPMGRIADIHGRKKVFQMGIGIFTVASFFAAFSSSDWVLLTFRIIQGVGSAMIFGNVNAIVASVFPTLERGRALGIAATGAYLGLFLGPVLGGFLTQNLGWQSIFLFNVPLGIITIYAATKLSGEWKEAAGEKFDLNGTIILAASLITILLGMSFLPGIGGIFLMVMGIIGGFIFYRYEHQAESPLFNVDLFKNRGFTFNSLAAMVSYTASYPIIFLLSLYLQYVKVLSPQAAGLILAIQPLMITLFSAYAGRLSDKKDPRMVASSGMALTVIGLGIFAFLSPDTSIWLVVIGLIMVGLGFALFAVPNSNLVMSSVKSQFYGVASATTVTMRVLGQMLGMGIALLLMNLLIGSSTIDVESMGSFIICVQISFIIFSLMCLGAIWLSLRSKN
jgi:EmrB/QacA subfamily drug resistance transporter